MVNLVCTVYQRVLPVMLAAAEAHAESEGGGNLFSVQPGLAFWTLVTFVALLTLLRVFAWKPLMESLEGRERRIREALENAEKNLAEAKELARKHQEQLANAKAEARAIIEEGKNDALKLRDRILADAQAEAEDFRRRAKLEIERARDQALQSILEQVAVISTEIAAKIIEKTLDHKDHERLVADFIVKYQSSVAGNGESGVKRA